MVLEVAEREECNCRNKNNRMNVKSKVMKIGLNLNRLDPFRRP